MNDKKPSLPPQSIAMIRTMVLVALICGILIVSIFQFTLPIIKENKARRLKKAVFEVIPNAQKVSTYIVHSDGSLTLEKAAEDKGMRIHAGYGPEGELLGVALEAEGQGFQDLIGVLYGYSPAQERIVGLKVLDSRETPGLGDKIEKDADFKANFLALDVRLSEDQKALQNAILVVKQGKKGNPWEIDAITGATISSKAIGRILNESAGEWVPLVMKNLGALEGEKP